MSKGGKRQRQGNRNKSYSEREHTTGEFKRRHTSPANKERGVSVDEIEGMPDIDVSGLIPGSILMEQGKEYSP